MPNYIGDFSVPGEKIERAEEFHTSRPALNRRRDNQRRARVTEDFDQWRSDPDSFDFPGVDTPSDSPSSLPKDKPFFSGDDTGLRNIITDAQDSFDI